MESLSLIHLVNVTGRGGTGATAFRLARLLAGRGHRLLFCAPAGSFWAERAREAALEVSTEMELRAGFRVPGFVRDVAALRRMVRRRRADVVHVHRSAEYWRAALAIGLGPARPRLVRSRGVVTPLAPHLFNRWLHNHRTDLVICTARAIFDMYQTLPGFDARKVRLVFDGVDIEEFRPGRERDRAATRAELGIPAGAGVVAMVARFDVVKGHRHLVAAAPEVLRRHPGTVFLVAAGRSAPGGEVERELRAEIARLGVGPSFRFSGPGAEIPRLLAAADALALCSVGSEGSSRATLEAMAAGLPVVASSVGCLPDLVAEGQTGRLVPPGDSGALATRLCELLADAELRRKMGAAARRRAEEEFDERRVAGQVEELYRGLLEGASA